MQENIIALAILVGHFLLSAVWAGRIARTRGASYRNWALIGLSSGFFGVARAYSYAGRDPGSGGGGGGGANLA
jgi:hypothetical protein